MKEQRSAEEIEKYARQLVRRHGGSLSQKTIRGKVRYYLQWMKDGKYGSKYLKASEVEAVRHCLAESRGGSLPPNETAVQASSYECDVLVGERLVRFAEEAHGLKPRDAFGEIGSFIRAPRASKVLLVYGLRRTGKTTMLRQSILSLSAEERRMAAYVKVKVTDTIGALSRDLVKMSESGIRIVYVDEVTLLGDFIDCASLFSDVHAAVGMKIVLSGTDSLGFWFAGKEELYDRAVTVHTTFIPFREHMRLLGEEDIDGYIEYGGTLKVGDARLGHPDARRDEASFRDDESTRFYVDTAIARNIQNSLKYLENGGHFRHLRTLYEAGELTNAINRIVEDMNHRLVVDVIVREFKSSDLASASKLLLKTSDERRRMDVRRAVDVEKVTAVLAELLDIRRREDLSVGVTADHVREIGEYLRALDLVASVDVRTPDGPLAPRDVIVQPGLRYAQAKALVYALGRDRRFRSLAKERASALVDCILGDVKGRLEEDIVLLETSRAFPPDENPFSGYEVFKLEFDVGEFDMVVRDCAADTCRIYEIKHSQEAVPAYQARHLLDKEKIRLTERAFGEVLSRTVLYRGPSFEADAGVLYQNVNDYLGSLTPGLGSGGRSG